MQEISGNPKAKKHPYGLGRSFSLGRNKYYKIVYRRGKTYPGRLMVFTYLKDKKLKVGFSTSSKVGKAVLRNKFRRWMSEDFRMLKNDLKPGRYVFNVRIAAQNAAHRELTAQMKKLITKADLWKDIK